MRESSMFKNDNLTLEKAVEWRSAIWAPAVLSALNRSKKYLPNSPDALEVGFNSGAMSCYLAKNYNWNMTGIEVGEEQCTKAMNLAKSLGVERKVNFKSVSPKDTFKFDGEFDVIFLKSFLYHIKSWDEYQEWPKWLYQRLKKGGILLAIENGSGNYFDRFYRNKINKKCSWKNNILYNARVENLFKEVFTDVNFEYFGGIGQYFTYLPILCKIIQKVEKIAGLTDANNCFIVSIVARR